MSDINFIYRPKEPPRVIRVFISSTFRDMQAEREELVKQIFPQLRKLCEERGVTWSEVDLRWGITDEQKAENKVLPICLEEIRICRPYFIGLLGERYGWVPDEIPQALLYREKWLGADTHRSITELEILHGVLNDPAMADHALFYFRDPKYIDTLAPTIRAEFQESPNAEEILQYGEKKAELRAQERISRLCVLKKRIRASGFPLRENYPDPKTLGQLVLQDLTRIITTQYPEGKPLPPLDREAAEQEAYALSHIPFEVRPGQEWGVYISRQADLDLLDLQAQGSTPPLAIVGEAGSGKTSLLAYWGIQYQQIHQDELVLLHFIGATPESTQVSTMLARIMGEFKRHFDLPNDVPTDPIWIRYYFHDWLEAAAAKGRIVLIIDGLDQLENQDDAVELSWLSLQLPQNIRVILSMPPSKLMEELHRRRYPILSIQPLATAEQNLLIQKYLGQYSKTLSENLSEIITKAPQSANPLFLRTLLDELRLYGDHFSLKQRVEYYLSASTTTDLYAKVLKRYEEDYNNERPGLVGDVFSLIWAARHGLSESELLDILGSGDTPLPQALWAPLHLATEQSLVSRSGLMNYSHDYLRKAVENRYLPRQAQQQTIHSLLADYFATCTHPSRRLGELPWHLAEAHEFDRLYSLLEDLTFSMAIFQANPVDLKRYWALIEANTNRRMLEAYQGPLSDPNRYAYNDLWSLAVLLDETGHIQEAYNIRKYLYPRTNDPIRRGSLLDFQAETLFNQNRLDEALKLVEEEAAIGQSASSQIHVEASLVEKGKILHIQKRYDEALSVFEKALQISDQISHLHGRMLILGFKALTRRDQGFLDEAMQLHKEQETLARQLNEPESVRSCLINQAVVLSMMNRLPEALAIWEEQLLATRQRGEAVEEAICLSNMAWALNKLGKVNEALPVAEEAYALAKNRNLSRLLSEIEPTLNDIRRAINPPDEDFLYPGYPPQPENPALNSTFAEAWALAQKDNIEQAVALLNKTEQTCFLAGDVAGAVFSAMNRASLLARAAFRRANDGDIPAATTLLDAGEKIFRTRIDYQQGLAAYITGKALLLVRLGKLVDAKWQLSDARHLLAGLEPDESTERIKAILDKISSQLSTLTG